MTVIKIDKYEPKIERGTIKYYAIAGKKSYIMPDAYKDMYDANHLAIEERTLEMSSTLEIPDNEPHYIPLFTGVKE